MPPITDNKTLKQLYNAFDAFPLSPENPRDRELYVDCQKVRGDSNIIHELGQHIEWSDKPTCQLYAGHRGAGKSTELLRLRHHLQEQGYFVVYFAADEGDIDPEDARYTDILLACVRQLLIDLQETDPYPLAHWLEHVRRKNFGLIIIKPLLGDLPLLADLSLDDLPLAFEQIIANLHDTPSIRKQIREQIEPHTVGLLDALNEFIVETQHNGLIPERLVLIVDNLDRIVPIFNEDTQRTNHEEIFIDRSEQLAALNCHVIYTVPISLAYSEARANLLTLYDNMAVLPLVMVHERGQQREPFVPALEILQQILEQRSLSVSEHSIGAVFDNEAVVKNLCLMSGGHLWNLMQLIQGTLRYLPQFWDAEQAMARSVMAMREKYLSAFNEADWLHLAEVYLTQQMRNEQSYRDLWFNHGIFEYFSIQGQLGQNSKWHDVHPVIWDIEQFKQALADLSGGIPEQKLQITNINKYPRSNAHLTTVNIKNISVFNAEKLNFSSSLNIIIGENGTGKTHILKSIYSLAQASYEFAQENQADLMDTIQQKILHTFRTEQLADLINHDAGEPQATIQIEFAVASLNSTFIFDKDSYQLAKKQSEAFLSKPIIFFPSKEVISMYPNFGALYRDYHIDIDETYYDLCLLLGRPLAKGDNYAKVKPLLAEIEDILGGQVINKNGRFYLRMHNKPDIEMHLLAEGLRKIATLAYLVANDTLVGNIVFWDEPESNLNPKLMRMLVKILLLLIKNGTQVILATHSLFLLREFELHIKASAKPIPKRYFALGFTPTGTVSLTAGEVIHDIDPITTLDAEIYQSEEYFELLSDEDDS